MMKPHIIHGIMWGFAFPIISYQVITGKYSAPTNIRIHDIISYRVIAYSVLYERFKCKMFFTVQSCHIRKRRSDRRECI